MLDLSPTKLVIIFVVVVVLLGPKRLPEVARQLGAGWRRLRELHLQVDRELRQSLPDLPSSQDIVRFARSPVTLLNELADRHPDPLDGHGHEDPLDGHGSNGAADGVESATTLDALDTPAAEGAQGDGPAVERDGTSFPAAGRVASASVRAGASVQPSSAVSAFSVLDTDDPSLN